MRTWGRAAALLLLATMACGGGEDRGEGGAGAAGAPAAEAAGARGACLTVGYMEFTASASLFIAERDRLFDSTGVCVRTAPFATSNQMIDALAAGRVDYVAATSAAPVLALEAASPGRVLVTSASLVTVEDPFDAIVVRREMGEGRWEMGEGAKRLRWLEGKTIAVFPGSTATALLRGFLKANGVDVARVGFVPTPPQTMLAAVKSGAVDAAHVYEPAVAIASLDTSLAVLFGTVYGRQAPPNPQGVALLSARTAAEHPAEARALVAAMDRALTIMQRDTVGTQQLLAQRLRLPPAAAARMHLPYMSTHDRVDWGAVRRYAELLVSVGELPAVPATLDRLRYAP